jgi:uncharacterized damage-inducible protein DinB
MSRAWLIAIESEYRRYRGLAEGAAAQLDDDQFATLAPGGGNSVAALFHHLGGNLHSRFTDFLTSDGEKPWRDREGEFERAGHTRAELQATWETGWGTLEGALARLTDAHATERVTIRGVPLTVPEALQRSLAHVAYHVGQIVLLARSLRGDDWHWLSVAPGGSAAYAANPTRERGSEHARQLSESPAERPPSP